VAGEGRLQENESMAKTKLPENKQGEAAVQCEEELRDCRRSVKLSNRSMRSQLEKNKQDSDIVANCHFVALFF